MRNKIYKQEAVKQGKVYCRSCFGRYGYPCGEGMSAMVQSCVPKSQCNKYPRKLNTCSLFAFYSSSGFASVVFQSWTQARRMVLSIFKKCIPSNQPLGTPWKTPPNSAAPFGGYFLSNHHICDNGEELKIINRVQS